MSNHAQVLFCVSDDPGMRMRDIGARVGITERAVHRIVDELVVGGFVTRERRGRRNHYAVVETSQLPDKLVHEQRVVDLLRLNAVAPEPVA